MELRVDRRSWKINGIQVFPYVQPTGTISALVHSPESSCRPYSQTPDLHNSRDSTPSGAIYNIVERYVEAMHAFLSFAKAG
jgi:hypothetical protein